MKLDKAIVIMNGYEQQVKEEVIEALTDIRNEVNKLYIINSNPLYMEGRRDCVIEVDHIIRSKIREIKGGQE